MKVFFLGLLLCFSCYGSMAWPSPGPDSTDRASWRSRPEQAIRVSTRTLKNLADLCRVWGVLKYYHPAIARGEYDWDNELLAFLPQVNRRNFHTLMSRWISGLQLDRGLEKDTDTTRIRNELFQWIHSGEVGEKLCRQLRQIVLSRQPLTAHRYVFLNQLSLPQFPHEKRYPEVKPWDDCNYRLLTLFRIWNVIEYLYPYKALTDHNWNSVLDKHLAPFIAATTEETYWKALLHFTAEICDSHTILSSDTFKPYRAIGLTFGKCIPVIFDYIENQYVINKVLTDNRSLEKGDVVTHIGSRNLDSLTKAIKPYISASNDDAFHASLCMHFTGTDRDTVPLTILRNGQIQTVRMASCPHKTFIGLLSQGEASRLLTDSIGYIDISKLSMQAVPMTMYKLYRTKGLILDLREYPKDFVLYTLGSWLRNGSIPFAKIHATRYGRLGIFAPERSNKIGAENPYFYKGKVILLVNSATMSQGEFTAMAWSLAAPQATVIGSTTAGTDGNVTELPLPGNIKMMFTGLGVTYPDGSQTQRTGIKLQEEKRPTIDGIRSEKDELLERAIEIINGR